MQAITPNVQAAAPERLSMLQPSSAAAPLQIQQKAAPERTQQQATTSLQNGNADLNSPELRKLADHILSTISSQW